MNIIFVKRNESVFRVKRNGIGISVNGEKTAPGFVVIISVIKGFIILVYHILIVYKHLFNHFVISYSLRSLFRRFRPLFLHPR